MARVGEVDVRRVHVAVAQQPPGRAAAVALDDAVAGGGEDLGPGAAAVGHRAAGYPPAATTFQQRPTAPPPSARSLPRSTDAARHGAPANEHDRTMRARRASPGRPLAARGRCPPAAAAPS